MQSILEQITDWLKSMIISGIMGNLSGMFDSVNQQVGQIAGDVGTTPANFSPAVFCCGHVNHKHIQYHDGCL